MRSKIILWIRIPMLIPTTCLFVLSLTIVPPFQLPCRGLSSAGQFPAASYSAFVYGYRLLCRPFGRHRHLLGRSAPSPVPKRLSHCFTCSFFSLSSSSFSLSTICFAIFICTQAARENPRIRKIRTVRSPVFYRSSFREAHR